MISERRRTSSPRSGSAVERDAHERRADARVRQDNTGAIAVQVRLLGSTQRYEARKEEYASRDWNQGFDGFCRKDKDMGREKRSSSL